jgi:hypothetical protein
MTSSLTAFVLGVLVGVLGSLAIVFPRVGRVMAQIAGTAAAAVGIGLLIWAFDAAGRESELTGIIVGNIRIVQVSEALGWGAGLLIGGAVVLLLSFIRRSGSSERGEALRRSLGH